MDSTNTFGKIHAACVYINKALDEVRALNTTDVSSVIKELECANHELSNYDLMVAGK